MNYWLFILMMIHLIICYRIQKYLKSTPLLSLNQKLYNSILLWLIPFLWAFVIQITIKNEGKFNVMTQKKRGANVEKYRNGTGVDRYGHGM